jgi:hypothetical protein
MQTPAHLGISSLFSCRYRRTFRLQLEPGWSLRLLAGLRPHLASGAVTPSELAMALYGLGGLHGNTRAAQAHAGSASDQPTAAQEAMGVRAAAADLLRATLRSGLTPPHQARSRACSKAAPRGADGQPQPGAGIAAAAGASAPGPALGGAVIASTACPGATGPSPSGLAGAARSAVEDRGAAWTGRELSMALWGLGALSFDPGPAWMAAFMERCDVASRTFNHGSTVANVLYGLAVLRARPPAAWMEHFMWTAQRRLNAMDPQSLSMMAYALARLRYRPNDLWMTKFLRYCTLRLLDSPRDPLTALGLSSQERAELGISSTVALEAALASRGADAGDQADPALAPVVFAAARREQARLRYQQLRHQRTYSTSGDLSGEDELGAEPAGLRVRAGPAAQPDPDSELGPRAGPHMQCFNNLLWALVRLSVRPSNKWLRDVAQAMQTRLPLSSGWEAAHALWAFSRLSFWPGADWLLDVDVTLRTELPRLPLATLVLALQGYGGMCARGHKDADAALLDALCRRLEPYLPNLQTTTLISLLTAVARLTPAPPPRRVAALLAVLLPRLRASVLGPAALQGMALAPPPATSSMDEALAAPEAASQALPSSPTASVDGGEAPECSSGSVAGGSAAAAAPAASLPSMTTRELVNAVFAVGCALRRAGRSSPEVRGMASQMLWVLMSSATSRAAQLNGVDLIMLLKVGSSGCAALHARCGAPAVV